MHDLWNKNRNNIESINDELMLYLVKKLAAEKSVIKECAQAIMHEPVDKIGSDEIAPDKLN